MIRRAPMQLDQSLLDEAMEKACTKPNPALTRRITRSVIMELKKQVVGVHSFRVQLYSHLCGVDPTSERAIFNHYGRVAVEGRAMTSYDREVALVAEYDVVAGELQQVEVL